MGWLFDVLIGWYGDGKPEEEGGSRLIWGGGGCSMQSWGLQSDSLSTKHELW